MELAAAAAAYKLTVLRVFLHTLAFEHVGPALHQAYLKRFLAVAAAAGMRVGFVLFGDGWNHGSGLPHAGARMPARSLATAPWCVCGEAMGG